MIRQCRFIRPLLMRMPPDPASLKPRDLGEMLFLCRGGVIRGGLGFAALRAR